MIKVLALICTLFYSHFVIAQQPSQATVKDTTQVSAVTSGNNPPAAQNALAQLKKIKSITILDDTLGIAPLGRKIKIQFDSSFTDNFNDDYILYINGIPLKGIKAINKNSSKREMVFKLLRTKDEDDILNTYYKLNTPFKKVEIGVGTESKFVDSREFTIILYDPWILGAGVVLILILLISFFYLNSKYPIIKDDSKLPNKQKSYSLSRSQFAWWTIVILSSFIFLICITGELFAITGSSVILLTISAATFASSKLIDNSDKTKDMSRHQEKPSRGFFIDLLSDDNGVSMARFQNIAFNIVIGIYFLYEVIINLKMPEIDGSLLALMGVSSGTYAIMKSSENKSEPAQPGEKSGNNPGNDSGNTPSKPGEDDNSKGADDANSEPLPVG